VGLRGRQDRRGREAAGRREEVTSSNGALLDIAAEIVSRGHHAPAENLQNLTLRDRILVGFSLKMLATFEALLDDATRRRGEAMHHLKTLCEAFNILLRIGC
jgi:hypothetical protein